jgi:hypothetical protein
MVCLFLVQWSAALAPLCRSQRPAHTGAATLTIRFRGRLQGLEPESTADPSAAGRLARRGRKDQIRPPPGPLRDPHRAVAFRWTQLSEGAMGLAPAIGADQARKQADKRQSTLRSNVTEDGNAEYRILCTNAATPESCTTHMGASPGLRQTSAGPARCSQGPHWEACRPSSPHSSGALPITYATLLRSLPCHLRAPSDALPVAGVLSPAHRQHWFTPLLVHPRPLPPKHPLP